MPGLRTGGMGVPPLGNKSGPAFVIHHKTGVLVQASDNH